MTNGTDAFAVTVSSPGWIRTERGDYFVAWMTPGGLCLVAAALCLLVPRRMPFPDADPEPVGHESVPDVG